MMRCRELSAYLDSMFQVAVYGGLDTSFSKRMHLFPEEVLSAISPLFLSRYNGLMLENCDEITGVAASCFLSDDAVDELRARNADRTLLICHHMLDIDAGQPGTWNARGFSAISAESLAYLKEKNISVYILHLPLDANRSPINTHLSLCRRVGLRPQRDLLTRDGFTMGFLARGGPGWMAAAKRAFPASFVCGQDGGPQQDGGSAAVLAGMVSSVSMLEEIAETGCSCLVCGDVLLRQRTERAEHILRWLEAASLPVICFSHKRTEEPALEDLLTHLKRSFPALSACFVRGGSQWK